MITRKEIEWTAMTEPAAIALYLQATGWKRGKTLPDWEIQPWKKRGWRGTPIVQFLSLPDDWAKVQHGQMLHRLSNAEDRSPQAILWDWQATAYSRVRFTFCPRLASHAGVPLLALGSILGAFHQGLRQAALQVERSGLLEGFQAAAFLRTLQLLPHETTDYDMMIGSPELAAGPVWTEFLALLARPATAITPRRELEPGETHYVLEPLRQAMKEAGITDLSGQYLQAGEPNVAGTGLLFRFSAEGGILMGGDD